MPWQMKRQRTSTSSGFIISGRRILCNAHGVSFYSSVRVRKHGDATKYMATVSHVGNECDLAVLEVADETFWQDLVALEFGGVPNLQETVVVVGYPTGGDNISVTKGVVSRVDVSEYSHAGESLLAIQIDAAINAGNSGGPTLMGDKVVGVAFEALDDAENVGYIISVPVIQHFLDDIEKHGKYTGFCVCGFSWQTIENKSMRHFLQMADNQHGIAITKVRPLCDASTKLKSGDVLMAIDDVPISDDGTISYRKGERVQFRYIASKKFVGDTCKLTLLRAGEVETVEVEMQLPKQLVRLHLYDQQPRYYVYAGLVFHVLSRPFLLSEYGKQWPKKSPIRLCEHAFHGGVEKQGQEIVVLSQVLVHECTIGYQETCNLQVNKVNGTEINSLNDVRRLCETNDQRFLRIDLERDSLIVLACQAAKAAHQEILNLNHIGRPMSADISQDKFD